MQDSGHERQARRRCGWHRCCREFLPGRRNQIYCGGGCRTAWQAWARMRGIALVQPLMDGDAHRLESLREDLLGEVESDRNAAMARKGEESEDADDS